MQLRQLQRLTFITCGLESLRGLEGAGLGRLIAQGRWLQVPDLAQLPALLSLDLSDSLQLTSLRPALDAGAVTSCEVILDRCTDL